MYKTITKKQSAIATNTRIFFSKEVNLLPLLITEIIVARTINKEMAIIIPKTNAKLPTLPNFHSLYFNVIAK
ncbi:hypothetical protein [Helicobacter pullorum]|uniref:hypothetical protein n=1 Tax=Helicobacter pullorum TaxID=35818 RepID=UPI001315631F|nr:hypothetical protein [Helicobacter pullorum]